MTANIPRKLDVVLWKITAGAITANKTVDASRETWKMAKWHFAKRKYMSKMSRPNHRERIPP